MDILKQYSINITIFMKYSCTKIKSFTSKCAITHNLLLPVNFFPRHSFSRSLPTFLSD